MKLAMLPSLGINEWTEESLSGLAVKITNNVPKPLILIDGAAGSGKTTLAEKLADILNADLVHTDDVSWCADPVHWDGEMLEGIVKPWLNGTDVSYKPTGWIKENRAGSIDVDSNRALIIEGMGAGRKALRENAAYTIWVDTEPKTARERVVQRDLANGENGGTVESVTKFADWWDSLFMPLFLDEEPWKYADIIVNGTECDLLSGNLKIHVPYTKTKEETGAGYCMQMKNPEEYHIISDIESLIGKLELKDNTRAYQALQELERISDETGLVYHYIHKFLDMTASDKYVIRVRGFRLLCRQAKWDRDNILDEHIDDALGILNDEKPTAVRQALEALSDVARYKPDLRKIVKKAAADINYLRFKDTMHSLIAADIEKLLTLIGEFGE